MRQQEENGLEQYRRNLYWGMAAWCSFSVAAVALRGVRWEETYEAALVITRAAAYPEGHPIYVYFRNLFSAQNHLTAAIFLLVQNPLVLCGLRNVLFLIFTVVPAFLLGSVLTRRALCGHAAAAFVLLGVHVNFQSYYPINVWPSFFSVGPIGAGWVLLILACAAAQRWPMAFLLTGLLPAVHLGQAPGLCLLFAAAAGAAFLTRRAACLPWRAWPWAAAGLALSLVFYGIHVALRAPLPDAGPYYAEGDVRAIWAAYTALHDVHRSFPRFGPFGHTVAAMLLLLFLSAIAARREYLRLAPARPFTWIFAYAVGVAGIVWGILAIHTALGAATPFLLIGWMPYRLANHLAMLLPPVSVALLFTAAQHGGLPRRPPFPLMAALALGAAWPLLRWGLPAQIAARYFETADCLIFFLSGGAAMAGVLALWSLDRFRAAWLLLGLFGLMGLWAYHQFAAACATAGILTQLLEGMGRARKWGTPNAESGMSGAFSVERLGLSRNLQPLCLFGPKGPTRPSSPTEKMPPQRALFFATALCMLIVVEQTAIQAWHRESLPVTNFQRAVAARLAERGESTAMLLTPYWNIEWLGRTGHPVMADYQTAHLMSYMPRLAPALKKMFRDLYGIEVDQPERPLLEPWVARTPEEWKTLGEEYGFRYVISPDNRPLHLPVLYAEDGQTLYALPPK